MRKNKIFVACDSTDINKIKRIIKQTENSHFQEKEIGSFEPFI